MLYDAQRPFVLHTHTYILSPWTILFQRPRRSYAARALEARGWYYGFVRGYPSLLGLFALLFAFRIFQRRTQEKQHGGKLVAWLFVAGRRLLGHGKLRPRKLPYLAKGYVTNLEIPPDYITFAFRCRAIAVQRCSARTGGLKSTLCGAKVVFLLFFCSQLRL